MSKREQGDFHVLIPIKLQLKRMKIGPNFGFGNNMNNKSINLIYVNWSVPGLKLAFLLFVMVCTLIAMFLVGYFLVMMVMEFFDQNRPEYVPMAVS